MSFFRFWLAIGGFLRKKICGWGWIWLSLLLGQVPLNSGLSLWLEYNSIGLY